MRRPKDRAAEESYSGRSIKASRESLLLGCPFAFPIVLVVLLHFAHCELHVQHLTNKKEHRPSKTVQGRFLNDNPHRNLQCYPQSCRSEGKIRGDAVIDLKYSLVIEATEDPTFFGFYSPDLEGFTGIGHSIEDCLYQAKWGMEEHLELLKEQSLPIPKENADPKIVIQNQESLAQAS